MPKPTNDRVCAEVESGVVLFLLGVRINRLWKPGAWLPVFAAMSRMLTELAHRPELGLLSTRAHFGLRNTMVVQYWKSVEHLLAYARSNDKQHLPAWQAFNRAVGTNGDVGIWHETYVAPPGQAEAIYVNMPLYGLGLAGKVFAVTGDRSSAAKRLHRREMGASS